MGEDGLIIHEQFQVLDEVQDCIKLFEALEHTLSASWEMMAELAEAYYRENGDLLPPANYATEEGYHLGQWVIAQRLSYHKHDPTLTAERIRKLESIGMSWLTLHERLWEESFALGAWYRFVRKQYQNDRLSEERKKRLEQIGISRFSVKERNWQRYFEAAEAYCKKYGNANIPTDHITESGLTLGKWTSTQRTAYAKKTLTAEKIERLNSIGFSWQRDESRWETGFAYLTAYFKDYGHTNVVNSYLTQDGYALGRWVAAQRNQYKAKKLSAERMDKLNALRFCWDPYEDAWQEGYTHAKEYYARYGDLSVPASYVCTDGFKLGAWVRNKKTKLKEGTLPAEKERQLEQIGLKLHLQSEEKRQRSNCMTPIACSPSELFRTEYAVGGS